MARVLNNLQRVKQPAAGKLNGLGPLSTSASEAQRRSEDELAAQLAPHEAPDLQSTADAEQSQDSIISNQDAATGLKGIDVPQGNLQSGIQAMSVVHASPLLALHPLQCMCPMYACACPL